MLTREDLPRFTVMSRNPGAWFSPHKTKCPCCPEDDPKALWGTLDIVAFLSHVWVYHCKDCCCPCGVRCGTSWESRQIDVLLDHLDAQEDPVEHLRDHHRLNVIGRIGA